MVADFTNSLRFNLSFDLKNEERWIPLCIGTWKVNCDASYKDGHAALEMVIKDECGILIEAHSKVFNCCSAYEAEVKVVEWATRLATDKGCNLEVYWDRLCEPKAISGIGFRSLEEFNRSLLAKQY